MELDLTLTRMISAAKKMLVEMKPKEGHYPNRQFEQAAFDGARDMFGAVLKAYMNQETGED